MPAVIVNGQYDVRSPQMFEVVDFLIAKPAVPQAEVTESEWPDLGRVATGATTQATTSRAG
ncbi:MAG: hypothetical protein IPL59_25300 [Candidatus Competibacteraceae bacterium]|nr:hypothetical protein [Candidatus Competibacteraceae bacterium]